jgi:two-component system CheB/CheR fusion protein
MSNSEHNPDFEALLNYIRLSRGFDFTGYKRSTLMRRVQKRMQAVKIESYTDYMDYLEVHPQEFAYLFNTILINVTSFFRDSSAWNYLAKEIIPQIMAGKELDEPIRFWSAGCASGQEAYTLAIVLAEALGVEQFRAQVKIYATDMDEEALNQARHATYNASEMASIPEQLLEQYFEHSNSHYSFRKDLRRSVIFGRHNLVADAPISRIDLLLCRNTLMYFNAEAQAKILSRFHFALRDGGVLFLGKAEMLLKHNNSFKPIDMKRRIFIKVSNVSEREDSLLVAHNGNDEQVNYLAKHVRLADAAFATSPFAQVVVDLNGLVTLANDRARSLFGLNPRDLSHPLQDFEFSYRPVELRSCIEQAYADRRVVNLKEVEWSRTLGDTQYFDVQVTPLFDLKGDLLGVNITFIDVTRSKRLQQELEHSNQELEMAYEELQSSNEELETTNEELQSANEELETTNEELQSTNEEMETMNEELQSANEELQTLNDELRIRTEELNSVNTFFQSILTNLRGGVVVVNRDMYVQIWSPKAEEMWGLRASEVQRQHFLSLDIGLPVEQLVQPVRTCLLRQSESLEVTLDAVNRRGRKIQCTVTCTPLIGMGKETQGVIMLMEVQENQEA